MPRRTAYTQVVKYGQERPRHVAGKGDVAYKGFSCPGPECQAWITIEATAVDGSFEITCEACGTTWTDQDTVRLFAYDLMVDGTDTPLEQGLFELLVGDYVTEAQEFKYCVLCYALKPMDRFDRHSARQTGRQGECNMCKRQYNSIKNQTRLADQHREAAQKRRLYVDLGAGERFDAAAVRQRFEHRCFKCGVEIGSTEGQLDHTLPAKYLWPLTTASATLLCGTHNGEKGGKWPSAFYERAELRRLSVMTGIDYDLLAGPPRYNPEALARLQDAEFVDRMLEKYAPYMDELQRLRNRVLQDTRIDFFLVSERVSVEYIRAADAALGRAGGETAE